MAGLDRIHAKAFGDFLDDRAVRSCNLIHVPFAHQRHG